MALEEYSRKTMCILCLRNLKQDNTDYCRACYKMVTCHVPDLSGKKIVCKHCGAQVEAKDLNEPCPMRQVVLSKETMSA